MSFEKLLPHGVWKVAEQNPYVAFWSAREKLPPNQPVLVWYLVADAIRIEHLPVTPLNFGRLWVNLQGFFLAHCEPFAHAIVHGVVTNKFIWISHSNSPLEKI